MSILAVAAVKTVPSPTFADERGLSAGGAPFVGGAAHVLSRVPRECPVDVQHDKTEVVHEVHSGG